MPMEAQGLLFGRVVLQSIYNDFLHTMHSVIIRPDPQRIRDIWLDISAWNDVVSGKRIIILPFVDYKPYVDGYKLIAPPLHGFLTGIFIQISLLLSNIYNPSMLITIYYVLQAISSTICTLLTISYLHKKIKRNPYPLMIITMLIYGIYGIEPFALLFITLSVINFLEQKDNKALLYAGLASCFSYFAFILFGAMIFVTLKKDLKYSHISSILLSIFPYFLVLITRPQYLNWIINGLLSPLLNCSLYQFISISLGNEIAFRISVGIWLTILLIIYSIHPAEGDIHRWPSYIAGFSTLMYVLHPQTVPQTLLLILPLIFITIDKDLKDILFLIIVEILNALIILSWFHASTFASLLYQLGLRTSSDPLSLDNPVQWIAQTRNAMLLVYSTLLIAESTGHLKN